MQVKFILYVGLNDQHTSKQEVSTENAINIVNATLALFTNGSTITVCTGNYYDESTHIQYREQTLKIELMYTNETIVQTLIGRLKKALNQSSILLETQTIGVNLL